MNYIFTCGGTAGHVNPAIAVAQSIYERHPDSKFLFIGAEGQMEEDLVRREGYDFTAVKITNISRGTSLADISHNVNTVKNVAVSIRKAREIIKAFKPDAVIGTGGYVCFPVISAAHELKIPTFIHESNAVPGLTTKMLASFVDHIFLGFEESKKYYNNSNKVFVTGTPVRLSFSEEDKASAGKRLGLEKNIPLVLSMWGSLGSEYMNRTVREFIPVMETGSMYLIHSTGKKYYRDFEELIQSGCTAITSGEAKVSEYLYNIPDLMTAADLVICRAGASTISELTYLGKPALIVPSPNVTNNHQEKNARLLEAAGAAKVMLEGEFTSETFLGEIRSILNSPELLRSMSENMKKLGKRDSAGIISDYILEHISC